MNDEREQIHLVRQAQAGNTDAFNRLVGRFQDRAVGYAFRLLRNRPDAEDAAQDAFVQLWRDLPRLRDPRVADVYLRRMIFKYCDRRKRSSAAPTVSLDEISIAAAGDEPFAALLCHEQRQTVARALLSLPPSQRQITGLRYSCDLSLAEIAEQVGLPVGTVKNRLHAARKRLRKELWEMADEILTEQKPSDNAAFTGAVLAQIMTDFERQMRADPHLANRGLLTQARSGLDDLLKQDTPPDFTTARYGFDLLLRQDDWKSCAALLLRFLDGAHADSETAWAYLHLANALAMSDQPVGAVLAHQAFERWVRDKEPRLSPHWPYLPTVQEDTSTYHREAVRLLFLSQSVEFASTYLAAGRLNEYLQRADTLLAQPPHAGVSTQLRYYGLRMAMAVCLNASDLTRADAYVNQMYHLAAALTDPQEQTRWRLRAYGDHLQLLRGAGDSARFAAKASEMRDFLAEQVRQGCGGEGWLRGERHDLAHQFSMSGQYAEALPLWEENARTGGQMNGWGYLLHAGAMWHETADRDRTLSLLRDAAAHDDRDLTAMFQARPEFAAVAEDADFLSSVKSPRSTDL